MGRVKQCWGKGRLWGSVNTHAAFYLWGSAQRKPDDHQNLKEEKVKKAVRALEVPVHV